MRICYVLAVAAAAFHVHSDTVSALTDLNHNHVATDNSVLSVDTAQTTGANKRSLRTIDAKVITKVVKVPKTITIDELFNIQKLDEALDPKRADDILAKKPLGGWLDKNTLDEALKGNFMQKKTMFEKWHKDKRTSRLVTRLIQSDPAIEKKYRVVYKLYAEYLKMIYRKENMAKRLAANN
ncbi:hypothetical protein F442_03351 [Phytophthora nicotianae P10297]|uniref:RxLR effector protein n=1 Tax=Phytophthora nicotianae P10297 TaxID=1317064 RepID=W2ZX37_PHYNI|nr:hypothetical protein F442_03351 [Phytophthora nicotianae P10297]